MTTLQMLKEVKELIDTPDKWCQGSFISNVISEAGGFLYSKRCVTAAIIDAGETSKDMNTSYAVRSYLDTMIGYSLAKFNDTHTHQDVIDLLDKAIESLKPETYTDVNTYG